MEYSLFWDGYEDQEDRLLKIEKEIFLRKLLLIDFFGEELKKRGIALLLKINVNFCAITFEIKYGNGLEGNLINLVMNPEKFGVDNNFTIKYQKAINSSIEFENSLSYWDIKKYVENKIKDEFIEICGENKDWIRVIGGYEYYNIYMSEVLNKNLDMKEKIIKNIKV